MKDFFRNLSYKIQRAMQGRYGNDELSNTLTWTALALLVVSMFSVKLRVFYFISLAMIGWSVFRMYSKNLEKRRSERSFYLAKTEKVRAYFNLQKRKWAERKTHVYFKCPGCGKQLRVPKGKGKLRITCPGCGQVIEKKS